MSSMYILKYIKFDYGYKNYHLIQCWNSKLKVFNIDFEVNKHFNFKHIFKDNFKNSLYIFLINLERRIKCLHIHYIYQFCSI